MAVKKQETKPKEEACQYSLKSLYKGDKVIAKITCNPLTMKVLLKIIEDMYAVILHMNSDYAKKIGFLEGQVEALKATQGLLNTNYLTLDTELFKIKNKPWWKRFLGL